MCLPGMFSSDTTKELCDALWWPDVGLLIPEGKSPSDVKNDDEDLDALDREEDEETSSTTHTTPNPADPVKGGIAARAEAWAKWLFRMESLVEKWEGSEAERAASFIKQKSEELQPWIGQDPQKRTPQVENWMKRQFHKMHRKNIAA